MFRLTVVSYFEAAHCIPNYPGKCQRLHGHNWKIEVCVKGDQLNSLGMLIDFKDLKQEVNKVVNHLDHVYLNELPEFEQNSPTAENLAKYVYKQLACQDIFKEAIVVESVTVWESQSSAVTYTED